MEEIRRVLIHPELLLLSLDDVPGCPEVVEDGETFGENAAKKALEVACHANMPALSDDSGLEVDALNGDPGVRSARYAGDLATDAMNVDKLLTELARRPAAPRTARFQCVIALATPQGQIRQFAGSVAGRIATTPQGSNGFGYDPIFIPDGYDITFAQMDGARKDSMSHRGRALATMALGINEFYFMTNLQVSR